MKASEATTEELLMDLCNYEDPDTMLCISTHDGGAFVMTYDGLYQMHGETLNETLVMFGQKIRKVIGAKWFDEAAILDWSDYA